MSSGLVVCSACGKEVHQDGPRDAIRQTATWRHCYRFHGWTLICEGAGPKYPQTRAEITGMCCQADGLAPVA